MTITRRAACRLLCTAGAATLAPRGTTAQQVASYNVQGTGPVLITFDRAPRGYFDTLTSRYRVVVIDYPPMNPSPAFIDTFTADRVSDDILAVADAVGASRFAWFGFSWGAVVGLQLAVRTNRLTALACGGWPPLGGQYHETLAVTEAQAARGEGLPYVAMRFGLDRWSPNIGRSSNDSGGW